MHHNLTTYLDNGRILAKVSESKSVICAYPAAKSVYNLFIKTINEALTPIKIRTYIRKPAEVIQSDDLNKVFQLLTIKEGIEKRDDTIIRRLPSSLQGLPNEFLHLFLPKEKNQYLSYLIEHQEQNYKFVPLFESGDNNADAFLFTIKNKGLIIVWENLSLNTATFAFKCNNDNHDTIIQRIYDYACSDVSHKRLRLHPNDLDPVIDLEYSVVFHRDLKQWIHSLML